MDLDVDVQEVEETVTVRVLARVGMRRSHEGGYRIEVEMAVGLRGVFADVEQRGGFVDQDEVDRVRPIDAALVDGPTIEPDREVRGPHRKACRRQVVDLQGGICLMERPGNGKVPRRRYLNARVHEEKVEQAVPIRIVSAVGMRRSEMAGPGEHDGFRGYAGRDGLGLRGHRGPAEDRGREGRHHEDRDENSNPYPQPRA